MPVGGARAGKSPHNTQESECLRCGNPIPDNQSSCPFCGSLEIDVAPEELRVRKIDIGHNNWTVNQARTALERELAISLKRPDDFLVIVHGHGSSGKGGDIKVMVHGFANGMVGMKRLRDFISGEHLTKSSGAAKRVSTNFPQIKQLKEWNSRNPGLSILIF